MGEKRWVKNGMGQNFVKSIFEKRRVEKYGWKLFKSIHEKNIGEKSMGENLVKSMGENFVKSMGKKR